MRISRLVTLFHLQTSQLVQLSTTLSFNQVKVLMENNYGSKGEYVGLDVKAMRTTSDEDSYEHLKNSLAVFRALEEKAARWDYDYTGKLIADRKFEQLEMYTMNLLMGIDA